MRRGFLWLSGTDPDILAGCTNLPTSERIRFTGIGALVLVPAVLGTLSMSYAISTLTDNPLFYLGAGFVWGVIVLVIDRYLVSTVHKSDVSSGYGRAGSLLMRFVFAILIGIAVAHPIVLLWFDDSIEQTIAENRRAAVEMRTQEAKDKADNLPTPNSTVAALTAQHKERLALKDCLTKLQFYEQSTAKSKELSCGITSGMASCGPRCMQIGVRIADVQREIAGLSKQIKDAEAADTKALADRQKLVDELKGKASTDVVEIKEKFSSDYLARVVALEQLKERNPQIAVVEIFMILFFVFVDILPLIMKLATPKGEYETVRDTLLMKANATAAAHQGIIKNGMVENSLAEAYAETERLIGEADQISRVPLEIIKARSNHLTDFERRVRELRKEELKNGNLLTLESEIHRIRELDAWTWNRVLARALEFMKRK